MVTGPPCRNITREVKTVVMRRIFDASWLLAGLVDAATLELGVGLAVAITILSFTEKLQEIAYTHFRITRDRIHKKDCYLQG